MVQPISLAEKIIAARQTLAAAENVLVITGAGISADSGVPTFRGEGAVWNNKHFSELANPRAFRENPREIWDWYLYRRGVVAKCRPNAAHLAVAKWVKNRPGVTLVTQNVDGLHEATGHPDVIRFHGSLWHNRCTACGHEREDRSLEYLELPLSPCCRTLERPAIVWFGETIPQNVLIATTTALKSAQAVFVIGTSGEVEPAASIIEAANQANICVIDVNPANDAITADLVIPLTAQQAVPLILNV
jgi:NAD-dependent deacetylase